MAARVIATPAAPAPAPAILRRRQVETTYGVGRSTIYDWTRAKLLPPPITLGPRAVGWIADELRAVYAARAAGANDDAVRALVAELVAARNAGRAPATT